MVFLEKGISWPQKNEFWTNFANKMPLKERMNVKLDLNQTVFLHGQGRIQFDQTQDSFHQHKTKKFKINSWHCCVLLRKQCRRQQRREIERERERERGLKLDHSETTLRSEKNACSCRDAQRWADLVTDKQKGWRTLLKETSGVHPALALEPLEMSVSIQVRELRQAGCHLFSFPSREASLSVWDVVTFEDVFLSRPTYADQLHYSDHENAVSLTLCLAWLFFFFWTT